MSIGAHLIGASIEMIAFSAIVAISSTAAFDQSYGCCSPNSSCECSWTKEEFRHEGNQEGNM